jgi:hypothetical protein
MEKRLVELKGSNTDLPGDLDQVRRRLADAAVALSCAVR